MKRSKGGEACEAGISEHDMPMQHNEAYRRLIFIRRQDEFMKLLRRVVREIEQPTDSRMRDEL